MGILNKKNISLEFWGEEISTKDVIESNKASSWALSGFLKETNEFFIVKSFCFLKFNFGIIYNMKGVTAFDYINLCEWYWKEILPNLHSPFFLEIEAICYSILLNTKDKECCSIHWFKIKLNNLILLLKSISQLHRIPQKSFHIQNNHNGPIVRVCS